MHNRHDPPRLFLGPFRICRPGQHMIGFDPSKPPQRTGTGTSSCRSLATAGGPPEYHDRKAGSRRHQTDVVWEKGADGQMYHVPCPKQTAFDSLRPADTQLWSCPFARRRQISAPRSQARQGFLFPADPQLHIPPSLLWPQRGSRSRSAVPAKPRRFIRIVRPMGAVPVNTPAAETPPLLLRFFFRDFAMTYRVICRGCPPLPRPKRGRNEMPHMTVGMGRSTHQG